MPSTLQATNTRDLVIGLAELAEVLGITPENLKRTWLKLHQKHAMPRKHAAGWLWPRGAINIWLTSQAAVSAIPGNDNAGETPADLHPLRVAEQRAALHKSLGVSS